MSDTNPHGDMEEVFQEFISESREMLDEVEPSLIELESHRGTDSEVDAEIIASIFRVFHSVKGSAGFLQLDVTVQVTHQAETLLDLIRKGKSELLPDHTDLLCRCCDLIRLMLDVVEGGKSDAEHAAAGGTMEAELRQAIYAAKRRHATASRSEQERGADRAAPKRASKARQTSDRADIQSQIEQLKDLAGEVNKDELSKLAKMHGLCEALTEGAAPEDAGAASFICERVHGVSRMLESLILDEADAPEAAPASVVTMVSDLSLTRESEDTADAQEQESARVRPVDAGTEIAEEPAFPTGAEAVEQFAQESDDALKIVEQRLLELEKDPTDRAALEEARRQIHSFKGNCGLCGYTDMERLSHRSEEVLKALLDGSGSPDACNSSFRFFIR
jgi:chemotaxis protein histidine kinase CheA